MLSGKLRKRIVVQSRSTSQDSYGQQVITWSDVLYGTATGAAKTVTGATAGATTSFAATLNGFVAGQLVKIAGITGGPNLNATFQVATAATNSFTVAYVSTGLTLGVSSATATPVTGVAAEVMPLFAYEKTGQGRASEVHQVGLRYASVLADPVEVAAMRVVYGTRILEVTGSINVEERNREMVLTCTEGLTQG